MTFTSLLVRIFFTCYALNLRFIRKLVQPDELIFYCGFAEKQTNRKINTTIKKGCCSITCDKRFHSFHFTSGKSKANKKQEKKICFTNQLQSYSITQKILIIFLRLISYPILHVYWSVFLKIYLPFTWTDIDHENVLPTVTSIQILMLVRHFVFFFFLIIFNYCYLSIVFLLSSCLIFLLFFY